MKRNTINQPVSRSAENHLKIYYTFTNSNFYNCLEFSKNYMHTYRVISIKIPQFFACFFLLKKISTDKKAHWTQWCINGYRSFSLALDKFQMDSSMGIFLSIFQLSFKINRVQVSDEVRLCVVESETKTSCAQISGTFPETQHGFLKFTFSIYRNFPAIYFKISIFD